MHPATDLPPHSFCPGLLGQAGFFTNDVVSVLRDAAGARHMDMQQNLFLLLLGLAVAIAALFFFLAAYFRYHNKTARLKLEPSPRPANDKNSPARQRLFTRRSARRKRRRQGEPQILTRNPTLAETGGLPPRRPENQPPNF